jgi:hypothetical protein
VKNTSFYIVFLSLVTGLLTNCTQPKGGDNVVLAETPLPSTTATPIPKPSATLAPLPLPSVTPAPIPPRIILNNPQVEDDFSQEALTVSFTVTPNKDRTLTSVTVTYNGGLVQSFSSPRTTDFKIENFNPNKNYQNPVVGQPVPGATPLPLNTTDSKLQLLTITALDDLGQSANYDFRFERPIKLGDWKTEKDFPVAIYRGLTLSDAGLPSIYWHMGGQSDNNTYRNTAYNFVDGQFIDIPFVTPTKFRSYSSGVTLDKGRYFFLMGGEDAAGLSDSIERVNPLAKSTETLTTKLTHPVKKASSMIIDNYLYLFGGENLDNTLDTFERIGVTRDGTLQGTWETLALPQYRRSQAHLWLRGSEIWVIGGGFRPIEIYSPSQNKWRFFQKANSEVVSTPEVLTHSLGLAVQDRYWLIGGERSDRSGNPLMYELEPRSGNWRTLGKLSYTPTIQPPVPAVMIPTIGLGGFVKNNKLYVYGGKDPITNVVSKQVYSTSLN